jgi:hypothetical protein
VQAFETLTRIVFSIIGLALMLLSGALIVYAGMQLVAVFNTPEPNIGRTLLDSVGYTVISIAVFEVAKYIFEEEVMNPSELGHTGEARRSMTKFISTIAIAIFLEALVAIFQASKEEQLQEMLYPTILLFGGVALVVGLGAYQRLSASAEAAIRSSPAAHREEQARLTKKAESGS